jgi:hypothetical protein
MMLVKATTRLAVLGGAALVFSAVAAASAAPTAKPLHKLSVNSYGRLAVNMKDVSEPAQACAEVYRGRHLIATGRHAVLPRRNALPPNSAIVRVQLPHPLPPTGTKLRIRLKLTAQHGGGVRHYDYIASVSHPHFVRPPRERVSRRRCG